MSRTTRHACFVFCNCSDGDVAWEAQVSSACLAKAGLKWDQQTQSIVRDTPSNTTSQQTNTAAAAGGSHSFGAEDSSISAAAAAAAPAADDGSFEGFAAGSSNGSGGSSSSGKQGSRVAVPADAPAGEEHAAAAAANPVVTLAAAAALAQAVASAPNTPRSATDTRGTPRAGTSATNGPVSGNSSTGVRHVKISPAKPTTMTYDAADGTSMQPLQGVRDAKSLLLQLFADFPTACLDMIDTTDADVILEGPVLTRAARKMPACMGRGSVVVLGEAAHPVRPSGEWTDIVVFGNC
jgi:hypothetical protein